MATKTHNVNGYECTEVVLPYSGHTVYLKNRLKGKDIVALERDPEQPEVHANRIAIARYVSPDHDGEATVELMEEMDTDDLAVIGEHIRNLAYVVAQVETAANIEKKKLRKQS